MPSLSKLAYARRRLVLKWRRFLGLCVYCGAEAYGNSKCDRCKEKANDRLKAKRKAFKRANLCQECGKNEVNSGGYRCDECLELMRLRKEPVKCHTDGCNNNIVYKHLYCESCLEVRNRETCKVYFIECLDCNKLFTAKTRGKKICDSCGAIRQRVSSKIRNREKNGLRLLTKVCAYYRCNNTFTTYNSNKTTCSELCSKRMMKRNENQTRRAVNRGAKHIDSVDIGELFIRDHGRCQMCGKKLNLKRKVPHPLAVTVDHIIPLSKGGEHSYRNTQLACFMCNSIKSNGIHPRGEQLRLFG